MKHGAPRDELKAARVVVVAGPSLRNPHLEKKRHTARVHRRASARWGQGQDNSICWAGVKLSVESVLTTAMSKKGGLLNFRCS